MVILQPLRIIEKCRRHTQPIGLIAIYFRVLRPLVSGYFPRITHIIYSFEIFSLVTRLLYLRFCRISFLFCDLATAIEKLPFATYPAALIFHGLTKMNNTKIRTWIRKVTRSILRVTTCGSQSTFSRI